MASLQALHHDLLSSGAGGPENQQLHALSVVILTVEVELRDPKATSLSTRAERQSMYTSAPSDRRK